VIDEAWQEFVLDDETKMILEMVHELAQRELAPDAAAVDRAGMLPATRLRTLAEQGLLAIALPESAGGAGAGLLAACLAIDTLARACPATAFVTSQIALGVAWPLATAGGAAGLQLAAQIASGQLLAVPATEEPERAAHSRTTRAHALDDGWHVVGHKCSVVEASRAQLLLVVASDGGEHALYPVAAAASTVRSEDLLGLRGAGMGVVAIDASSAGPRLAGADDLLGPSRLGLAAVCTGIASAALVAARAHARARVQFGEPIGHFGAVANMLGESALETLAARALIVQVARLYDAGHPAPARAHGALRYATQVALAAADRAVQVHGGGGFCRDYPVERLYRDAQQAALELGGALDAGARFASAYLALQS
jgi:alkylation response protein AidB-like acyl-CoA dehydrogenase